MKKLDNYGDTLIEVMFSLTITSMILTMAYRTVVSNLTSVYRSQERAGALKVAESQADELRAFSSIIGFTATSATNFCLKVDSIAVPPTVEVVNFVNPLPPTSFNSDTLTNYPLKCITNSNTTYYTLINRSSGGSKDFVIRVRWWQAGGNGKGEVVLNYSVY